MRKGYYMDLNGYSNFVVQKTNGDIIKNYTMTFACVPYTYESNVSGIVSAFSVNDKKGIAVGVKKKGIVVVRIGLGNMVVEIESLQEHLKFQKSNIVTVAFWGTAGWCDLYVNGRLSNRKQFPRHSKTFIPSGEYYICFVLVRLKEKWLRHTIFWENLTMNRRNFINSMTVHN